MTGDEHYRAGEAMLEMMPLDDQGRAADAAIATAHFTAALVAAVRDRG